MLLCPRCRWLARGTACEKAQRAAYHEAFAAHVRVRHAGLAQTVASVGAQLRAGFALGVHKRVYNPGTAEYQGNRTFPSCEGFVEATRRAISLLEARTGRRVTVVYLATDDAAAPALFERAFGSRLLVRSGVTRAGGGLNADGTLNEVHVLSPHNPYAQTLQEAVDVVADAMLLAACAAVVHVDSNVTSSVGYMSPSVEMLHVADLLDPSGRGTLPLQYVQHGYMASS